MAVARHAAGTLVSNSGSTITPTYPANSVGDILLMMVGTASTVASVDAGWVLVGSNTSVSGAATYVYWMPVSTVMSGTTTINTSAGASGRSVIASYSGASLVQPASSAVKTASSSSTTTPLTVPFAGDIAPYVYAAFTRVGASFLSAESASPGSWTFSEVGDGSGTASITAIDGPITGGTSATVLSATPTVAVAYGAVSVAIYDAATSLGGPASLTPSASLSATSTFKPTAAAGLTPVAALTAAGVLNSTPTAALKPTATLASSATFTQSVTPSAFSATATLGGATSTGVSRAAALSSTVALSAAGTMQVTAVRFGTSGIQRIYVGPTRIKAVYLNGIRYVML